MKLRAGRKEEKEDLDPKEEAQKILNILGDKGLQSLFENKTNLPDDVFVLIKFNCTKEFHKKYRKLSKPFLCESLPTDMDVKEPKAEGQEVDLVDQKDDDTQPLKQKTTKIDYSAEETKTEKMLNHLKMVLS